MLFKCRECCSNRSASWAENSAGISQLRSSSGFRMFGSFLMERSLEYGLVAIFERGHSPAAGTDSSARLALRLFRIHAQPVRKNPPSLFLSRQWPAYASATTPRRPRGRAPIIRCVPAFLSQSVLIARLTAEPPDSGALGVVYLSPRTR